MLEIKSLKVNGGKAVITFIAKERVACRMLIDLFASFIETHFSVEVYLLDIAEELPTKVEVTAVYEVDGHFGWTWQKPKAKDLLGQAISENCTTECLHVRQGTCPYFGDEKKNCSFIANYIKVRE